MILSSFGLSTKNLINLLKKKRTLNNFERVKINRDEAEIVSTSKIIKFQVNKSNLQIFQEEIFGI